MHICHAERQLLTAIDVQTFSAHLVRGCWTQVRYIIIIIQSNPIILFVMTVVFTVAWIGEANGRPKMQELYESLQPMVEDSERYIILRPGQVSFPL